MALLAEDPEYRLARYAEEGLVELWARRLLKDLSEHPISEEDDVDYFSAYNNILQGWRYIQRHAPVQSVNFLAWFSESDHRERVRLLSRYIHQSLTAHFESFNPTEAQRAELLHLLRQLENPSNINPLQQSQVYSEAIEVGGLVWWVISDNAPLTSLAPRSASEMLQLLRQFLR